MRRRNGGLTEREERYVKEFFKHPTQIEAYKAAGFNVRDNKSAHGGAGRLMALPHIQRAIAKEKERIAKRHDQSLDRWLREVLSCAFADPRELYDENGSLKPMSELEDHVAAAISEVETFEEYEGRGKNRELVGHTRKVRMHAKLEALKMAGQVLGYVRDKVNAPTPVQVNVNVGAVLDKLPLETRVQVLAAIRQAKEEPRQVTADAGDPGTTPS